MGALALMAALGVAVPAAAQEETQAEVHDEAEAQPEPSILRDSGCEQHRSHVPCPRSRSTTPISDVGVREELPYFVVRAGQHVTLQGGTADNSAWFALRAVPEAWESEPGAADGLQNFELAGPGLGSPDASEERETLLHDGGRCRAAADGRPPDADGTSGLRRRLQPGARGRRESADGRPDRRHAGHHRVQGGGGRSGGRLARRTSTSRCSRLTRPAPKG